MGPLVSVIIPTLNEEKMIGNTLKAVKNQTYKNIEIIVSDGCSSDKTVEIAKKYADKVIVKKSKNISHGRNIGAHHARGDILAFFDADCVTTPNLILKCVRILEKDKKVGCVIPYARPLEKDFVSTASFFIAWLALIPKFSQPGYMGIIIRRKVFEKVRGFNEDLDYCEDLDFLHKVSLCSKFITRWDLITFTSRRRWENKKTELLKVVLRPLEYLIFRKNLKRGYRLFH